ncbi:type II toxin-antitoxin system VapC family toxin [Granulicella sibirica]|uniref:PIN domain-containing protein n=1 Tax=Granulicella sibirica TaxID=2479048 RepID=A0A4Q0T1C5_9BACT|nr:type II toxin-antitoxin system VapC family toxin [Granulicella sibirica]RXH57373.1 hypothetical protein GRAN_0683 [Granulicella sibirica]
MRLLLDSNVLLWAIYSRAHLTEQVKTLLADEENELCVSHATLWKLLSKIGRSKLLLAGTSVHDAMSKVQDLGVTFLPIDEDLILAAASLPHHNSDPFDRMLIAQAVAEKLPVLTADGQFSLFDVSVIW